MKVSEMLKTGLKQLETLTTQGIKSLNQILISAANKRIARAEKAGIELPAVQSEKLKKSLGWTGSRFTNRTIKTKEQAINAFLALKNFLKSETSTLKGAKKFFETIRRAFKEKGVDIKTGNIQRFLNLYNRLNELDPRFSQYAERYKIASMLESFIESGLDDDRILVYAESSFEEWLARSGYTATPDEEEFTML